MQAAHVMPCLSYRVSRQHDREAAAAAATRAAGDSTVGALSFKPENLVRATLVEKIKAQGMMALQEAKRFRQSEQFKRLYTSLDQRLPPNVKPEHAFIGLLIAWFIAARLIGFSKAVLLTSLIMLLGMIVAPDLAAGVTDPKALALRIPRRFREMIVQSTGYTSITEKQAALLFCVFMLFTLKLLLTSSKGGGSAAAIAADRSAAAVQPEVTGMPPVPPVEPHSPSPFDMETIYKLGFDDAKAGLEFGSSMPKAAAPRGTAPPDDIDWPYDPTPPPAETQSSKFGFTWAMAAFGLFRGVKEMAVTPDGRFDSQFLVTNIKMQPPLKLALLAFCSYRVFSAFI